MDFVPLAATIALLWKIVDFAKLVRVRDVNAVVTQAVTWAAGVGLTFLLAGTDFADGIKIGDMHLGHVNASSLVLIGLSLASSTSVAYDFKRALDRTDSAAMPSLVTGLVPITPPAVVDADTAAGRKQVHRSDRGDADLLVVLLILLVLVFGGFGFAVHLLWIIAVVALIVLAVRALAR
jgi:hypothetical protein